jgi:hypothetical protein
MNRKIVMNKQASSIAAVFIACFSLAGCGGSSDDGQATGRDQLPPPTTTESVGPINPIATFGNINLYGDTEIMSNGSFGFALTTNDNAQIRSVRWQQINGPALTILANNSQTIGFDTLEAGSYTLQATVETSSGTQQISHDFTVQESSSPVANVRLDHTVTERGKVSLRVDSFTNDINNSTIEWKQIAGPAVLDLEGQSNRLFFNAPAVNSDQVVQFEVSVIFENGEQAIDRSIVTINDAQIIDDAYFPNSNIITSEDVYSFNSDSPYKNAIESCIYTNTLSSTCNFGTLPLVGQQTTTPSIDDILDRTLVSHEWMGVRFRQYLEQSAAGPDMLKLLRGVTAVVISYDVRPSFYWAATGAIYLDAGNFWVTPTERDTLNEVPDYRSDFGSVLKFGVRWRYVKDNAPYMPGQIFSSAARDTRTFDALEADISWLMYHELGHANDFFPYDVWASLTNSDDPLTYFRNNGTNSDILNSTYPLSSNEMKDLAKVSFSGETASDLQKSYVAADIETFFVPDIAASYYSYLTEREDFATLFERFMMQYRLGASADIGIYNTQNNSEVLITWGQRDRFNDPSIQARARFTVSNILPELGDIEALQAALPEPILLRRNVGWDDNIDLRENAEGSAEKGSLFKVPYRLEQLPSAQFYLNNEANLHKGRPSLPN